MRIRAALVAVLLALVIPSPGHAGYGASSATVYENNLRFCDTPVCLPGDVSDVTIAEGGHVTFTFTDAVCVVTVPIGCYHSVKSTTGAWVETAQQPLAGGLQVAVTFPAAGTFEYVCGKHGPDMHGTVHVVAY